MSKYTRIQARVIDQAIQLINVPLIASGGQNEVRVDFTFCTKWVGKAKTAVFYQNPEEAHHVLMDGDSAVVPPEVLAKDGHFYFGVFGTDTEQVRTTEVVRMSIVKGAITFQSIDPAEPTPDIYQQLLAAYAELTSPNGKAAVYRLKDQNGGRDVTLWIGTQEQYEALGREETNCIYIVTDAPTVTVRHEEATGVDNPATVRWYSDGYAELWINYRVSATTPHEKSPLFLSSRFTLPFPDIYMDTRANENATPIMCEVSLLGAVSPDITAPILLFTSGSDDGYKSGMRAYVGTTNQLVDETPILMKMHLVWKYKTEEA